jgi:hypothetical protein
MLDYLKGALKQINNGGNYNIYQPIVEDDLLVLYANHRIIKLELPEIGDTDTLQGIIHKLQNKQIALKSNFNLIENLILKFSTQNWVDVENEYFQKLTGLLNLNNIQELKDLNRSFELLKTKFLDYLGKQDTTLDRHLYRKYHKFLSNLDAINSNTLILNFNYTNLIESYEDCFKNVEIINIHGSLDIQEENPIIFGYGDDYHNSYPVLENSNIDDFMINMKAMHYSKTSNYLELLHFINVGSLKNKANSSNENFLVTVLGHSCGLSDRTMLKTIFEHKNCAKIQLAYFDNEEDHFYKTIAVSRHFSDKAEMRRKLNPINPNLKMPQFQKSIQSS